MFPVRMSIPWKDVGNLEFSEISSVPNQEILFIGIGLVFEKILFDNFFL